MAVHTVDGHAGQALDRFGQVLIGKVGHVFSQDGVHRSGFAALDVQRLLQAGPEAGDDDFIDHGCVLGGVLRDGF